MAHIFTGIAEFFREYKEYAMLSVMLVAIVAMFRDAVKTRKRKDEALESLRKEKDQELEDLRKEKDETIGAMHKEVLSLALNSERNRSAHTGAILSLKELLQAIERRL